MIHLQERDLIAWSKTRECYLHPANPDKVIKIISKKPAGWKRDANWKEWRHYWYLNKRHPQLDFITTYHGFVETNLGRGLVSDCIRDYNGRISVRLQKVLENPEQYDLEALENSLDRFSQKIVANNIQLFDLNAFNILIQVLSDGVYHLVSVDIKGRYNNYEFIPISTYIPFFSRLKLKRRIHYLMQLMQQARQKNTTHENSENPAEN